ncbi:MAG TPA: hypothetical protein VMD51_03325, partial [Mycobacterium sp.]|nr:hypothetical protein [Mycobacterium sp.]
MRNVVRGGGSVLAVLLVAMPPSASEWAYITYYLPGGQETTDQQSRRLEYRGTHPRHRRTQVNRPFTVGSKCESGDYWIRRHGCQGL